MKDLKLLLELVKGYFDNEKIVEDASYYTFLISLLPLPVIQQSAQVLDRMLNNHSLKLKIDEIWVFMTSNFEQLNKLEIEFEKIKELASLVNNNDDIKQRISGLLDEVVFQDKETEWVLETTNNSFQSFLNVIVNYDFAKIIAEDYSNNSIVNSNFNVKNAHLIARNNSSNYFDKTSFNDSSVGSVRMDNISTKGDVFVQGNTIGLMGGGEITFRLNPNIVSGDCPFCKTKLFFDKQNQIGKKNIQCSNCLKILMI